MQLTHNEQAENYARWRDIKAAAKTNDYIVTKTRFPEQFKSTGEFLEHLAGSNYNFGLRTEQLPDDQQKAVAAVKKPKDQMTTLVKQFEKLTPAAGRNLGIIGISEFPLYKNLGATQVCKAGWTLGSWEDMATHCQIPPGKMVMVDQGGGQTAFYESFGFEQVYKVGYAVDGVSAKCGGGKNKNGETYITTQAEWRIFFDTPNGEKIASKYKDYIKKGTKVVVQATGNFRKKPAKVDPTKKTYGKLHDGQQFKFYWDALFAKLEQLDLGDKNAREYIVHPEYYGADAGILHQDLEQGTINLIAKYGCKHFAIDAINSAPQHMGTHYSYIKFSDIGSTDHQQQHWLYSVTELQPLGEQRQLTATQRFAQGERVFSFNLKVGKRVLSLIN